MPDKVVRHDKELENFVFKTHKAEGRVLCLAARLGGEVRAFKRQGCDGIGIDLNPGDSPDVIKGDVHKLPFGQEFDYLYCNSIDHVLRLNDFFRECHRVLKPGGVFIMDVIHSKPGKYEVRDLRDDREIIEEACMYFDLQKVESRNVRFGLVRGKMTTYHATRHSH
jgi:SAM-dependent methyltransferase